MGSKKQNEQNIMPNDLAFLQKLRSYLGKVISFQDFVVIDKKYFKKMSVTFCCAVVDVEFHFAG